MELTIVGLLAYHIILLRAVNICNEKQLRPSISFVVGAIAGGIWLATVCLAVMLVYKELALINNSVPYTILGVSMLLLLGGFRCMNARRDKC